MTIYRRPLRNATLDPAAAREARVRAIVEGELVKPDGGATLRAATRAEIDRLVALCLRCGWDDAGVRSHLRRVAQADGDAAWSRAMGRVAAAGRELGS